MKLGVLEDKVWRRWLTGSHCVKQYMQDFHICKNHPSKCFISSAVVSRYSGKRKKKKKKKYDYSFIGWYILELLQPVEHENNNKKK